MLTARGAPESRVAGSSLGLSVGRTAPTMLRAPCLLLLLLLLLLFLLLRSGLSERARALERIDQDAPELRCGEGLTDCHMSSVSPYSAVLPDPNDAVDVTRVQLQVMLCCSASRDCEPCLRIVITVKPAAEQVPEESGEHTDEEELFGMNQKEQGSGENVLPEPQALVKVYLSSPGSSEIWRTLQFQTSQQPSHMRMQLSLTAAVAFDSPVVVHVYAHSKGTGNIQNITVPSLEEVCSTDLEGTVKECDAPRLRAETDHRNNLVLIQLENTEARRDDLMYQMMWNEIPGEILAWPKGKREIVISSNFVASCLCFQVWRKGKALRREFCPFKNQREVLERMQHNVSVSMVEMQLREGGTGLSWNVGAPCRLEAEVRLCKRDPAGGPCEEVRGSRQRLHNHAGWRATRNGHWNTGEFNVSSHPLLCVQIKIHGMESYLEPQCPFAKSRWRWSLPLLIGLLLMCLAILGAYFVQGVLKGAVGGGHVVLLYPADDNQTLPGLMCHLGSSLQALGFSVSLDLWSQAELSVLGPVPWLHSRLDRLKRQGGKVVLVLTQAAWMRAEEWGAQSWERNTPRNGTRHREEEEAGRRFPASSPCVDVFSASLSCILGDYLQGRAGERFMLVQFESLPPESQGGFWPLPELFRGLHVYSLPSQSLGFLTELAGAQQMATASARRKRAGGLRVASRALARGLSGFPAGTTILHFTGVSQSCVGVGVEESGETVPLQPCLITPPVSTDTSPRVKWNGFDSRRGQPMTKPQFSDEQFEMT
ncbi:interleukin-17 receptor C isoform X3 [Scophthalmus maximus]|uniref:interleukin-17 receptor C isoform X3 n=1 Tax=Scophthalmus maximus TaxID=52904 RepID=UPI001FA8F589|nr:interleukin-17 receptor C isoform X3 [Scophthalmus maximus]